MMASLMTIFTDVDNANGVAIYDCWNCELMIMIKGMRLIIDDRVRGEEIDGQIR